MDNYEESVEYNDGIEAVVGYSLGGKIMYNLVQKEPEFINTGMSVITQLKKSTNDFLKRVLESQKYPYIEYVYNDQFIVPDEKPYSIYNVMDYNELHHYDNVYIYNVEEDVLVVNNNGLIGLEYRSDQDVEEFINIIK